VRRGKHAPCRSSSMHVLEKYVRGTAVAQGRGQGASEGKSDMIDKISRTFLLLAPADEPDVGNLGGRAGHRRWRGWGREGLGWPGVIGRGRGGQAILQRRPLTQQGPVTVPSLAGSRRVAAAERPIIPLMGSRPVERCVGMLAGHRSRVQPLREGGWSSSSSTPCFCKKKK